MYNSRNLEHKSPFGALKTGEPARFALRIPQEYGCRTPVLFLQKEGEDAVKYSLERQSTQGTDDWFAVTVAVPQPGLYFYWFDLWVNFTKLYRGFGGQAVASRDEGSKYLLLVYDAGYETPASFHGSVMYQIFPDRYLEGDADKAIPYNERIYRADKHNAPYSGQDGSNYGSPSHDYFGGDFAGIQKRLPFLQSIGVEWIYLNPIFEAHSNHRYNVANYFKTDPFLGSNQDFANLCREAEQFGIKIVLDGVFSHAGADSVYFNKEGRYPSVGAWHGPQSPYRDWFVFHPDGGYDSWWGMEALPSWNKQNHQFRAFIAGEGGVIDHWLRLGAAGFRLHVADELPDDFIAEIRQAVKRNGADKLLIGEVWEDAATKHSYGARRRYLWGQGLDGVMNYPFRKAILDYLRWRDAVGFREAVLDICENYPPPALAACTTHLSTHDTMRAITALAGEAPEGQDNCCPSGHILSEDQYQLGIAGMKLAFVLQFTLPGVPCVYYGDEIAMQGYGTPLNRAYYDWTSSETRLLELMTQLSALRKNSVALRCGSIRFVGAQGGLTVYLREGGGETVAVAINAGKMPAMVNLLGEDLVVAPFGYAVRASDYDFGSEDTGQWQPLFAREQ